MNSLNLKENVLQLFDKGVHVTVVANVGQYYGRWCHKSLRRQILMLWAVLPMVLDKNEVSVDVPM